MSTPGLIQIKLGEKLKPVAVERFKMEEGAKAVVAILSMNIFGLTQHYHQNTGYFYCWGGSCCQQLGLAGVRYVIPVLEYSVEKFPSKYGLPFSIKYLAAGRDVYNDDILTKQEILNGAEPPDSIIAHDLSCVCSDSQYQKIKFDIMGACKWKKDPAFAELVKAEYSSYQKLIQLSVARVMTEERLLELLAENPDQGNRANDKKPSRKVSQITPQVAIESPTEDLDTLDTTKALPGGTVLDDKVASTGQDSAPVEGTPKETVTAEPNFDDLL